MLDRLVSGSLRTVRKALTSTEVERWQTSRLEQVTYRVRKVLDLDRG